MTIIDCLTALTSQLTLLRGQFTSAAGYLEQRFRLSNLRWRRGGAVSRRQWWRRQQPGWCSEVCRPYTAVGSWWWFFD